MPKSSFDDIDQGADKERMRFHLELFEKPQPIDQKSPERPLAKEPDVVVRGSDVVS